eukprot:4191860-Prymnesium_polylepis.1
MDEHFEASKVDDSDDEDEVLAIASDDEVYELAVAPVGSRVTVGSAEGEHASGSVRAVSPSGRRMKVGFDDGSDAWVDADSPWQLAELMPLQGAAAATAVV